MLINHGEDVYDEWVNHEIPFNDERVLEVMNQIEELLLTEGRVSGGRGAVAANNFGTAGNVMFDDPPGCFMYRQGNFLAQPGFFPDEIVENLDDWLGVFPLPGTDAESKPVLGGGDMASLFSADNEAAKKVMEYLASPRPGRRDRAVGGVPRSAERCRRQRLPTARSPAPSPRSRTRRRCGVRRFRPDAGGGRHRVLLAGDGLLISGQQDAKTTLDNIENNWPA